MMSPWLGLIIFVLAYSLAPIKQVALGVLLALVSLPLWSWFLYQPLGIDERLPVTLGMVVIGLMGLFKRVVAPRTPLSQSVPLGNLVLNRLLFDRDIWDRKTWISRTADRTPGVDDPIEEFLEQQEKKGKA